MVPCVAFVNTKSVWESGSAVAQYLRKRVPTVVVSQLHMPFLLLGTMSVAGKPPSVSTTFEFAKDTSSSGTGLSDIHQIPSKSMLRFASTGSMFCLVATSIGARTLASAALAGRTYFAG